MRRVGNLAEIKTASKMVNFRYRESYDIRRYGS